MPSLFDRCRACFPRSSVAADAKITLIVVGLSNSGKTTATAAMHGHAVDSAPTVGFNRPTSVRTAACTLTLYDVGGSRGIRAIWEQYWPEVHGVVFVVDAAAADDFPEAAAALREASANAHVRGKPILVLANKQDLPTAASAHDVALALELSSLQLSSFNVMPCTAKFRAGESPDPRIAAALGWLEGAILRTYATLAPRVARETEAWRQLEDARKKQRLRNGEAAAAVRRAAAPPQSAVDDVLPSSPSASKDAASQPGGAPVDGPEAQPPLQALVEPEHAPRSAAVDGDGAAASPSGGEGPPEACAGGSGSGSAHSQPRPPRCCPGPPRASAGAADQADSACGSAAEHSGSGRGSFAGGRDVYGRRSGSLVETPAWLTSSGRLSREASMQVETEASRSSVAGIS